METENKVILALILIASILGLSGIWTYHARQIRAMELGYQETTIQGTAATVWQRKL